MNLNFLDRQTNAEVLREFAKLTLLENDRFRRELAVLKKSLHDEAQIRLGYQDRLLKLNKKLFGSGTEKLDKELKPRKTDDVLVHGLSMNPDEEHGQKRTAKDRDFAGENKFYPMTDVELKDEADVRGYKGAKASDWEEIKGLYDESSEITVIERVYKKVTHKRMKYRFKPSIGTDKEIIVTARGPEKLYPGCGFSPEFAIAVVCDKYQYHTPLNRQVDQMEQKGLAGITAKTLYGLAEGVAAHAVKGEVLEGIRQDVFQAPLAVHADETPWPILDDHDSDGYLWVISNMAGSYYRFEPTRSGKIIVEMLKGYRGPVVSDDFLGYDRLKKTEGIVLCHCWAHARRNFYEIAENHEADCREILKMLDQLFAIEREAKTWDALKLLRNEKSKPLVENIRQWLDEKNAKYLLSESEMGKAIRYLLNNWDEFTVFLGDIRVPLSNNDAERALRHGVLGRKNFYGSKSINGADVAAVHYTVIETCKKVQLEPAAYYRYLIQTNNAGGKPLTPLGYVRRKYEQKKAAQKENAKS